MALWQWILAGVAAALVAREAEALPTADTPRPPGDGDAQNGYPGVVAQADKLARMLGWKASTELWFERFAQVQAWSESKGNFGAANRTISEKAAAKTAYERNAPKMPEIVEGTTPGQWYESFGSGGWYGLIPANGLWAFQGQGAQLGELSPNDVFDAWRSTVMLAAAMQRLTRWDNFRDLPGADRNAYALKRGLASPTLMDDVSGHRRGDIANKHVDDAVRSLGIPSSWKHEPVPSEIFQKPAEGWLAFMRRGESA